MSFSRSRCYILMFVFKPYKKYETILTKAVVALFSDQSGRFDGMH